MMDLLNCCLPLFAVELDPLSVAIEVLDRVPIGNFLGQIICFYVNTKESNSTANESKQQFNRSIIYYLNIVPIVNDSFWGKKKKKKKSGAAGTQTHGRGSVLLVSKLDAIPLRHKAQTFFAAQISH